MHKFEENVKETVSLAPTATRTAASAAVLV